MLRPVWVRSPDGYVGRCWEPADTGEELDVWTTGMYAREPASGPPKSA